MASTPQKKTKKKKPTYVKVREGELAIVTWFDACADVGWEDHRAGRLKPAHCRSVGWIGHTDDPKSMIILYADRAHDNGSDHDSNRRIAIPTGWVTGIKKVKE